MKNLNNVRIRKYLVIFKTSKLRFTLTVLGIFLASIFFLSGRLITDSIEYNLLETVEEFDDNSIIYSDISENSYNYLQKIKGTECFVPFYRDKESISVPDIKLNYYIDFDVIATSNYFSLSGVPYEDSSSISKVNFIEGRTWTEDEASSNSKVVVISSFTKYLLFTNVDPIGKTLTIPNLGDFEIIGVIDDLQEFKFQREEVVFPTEDNKNFIYPDLDILIPLSTYRFNNKKADILGIEQLVQINLNANQIVRAIDEGSLSDNYSDLKNNNSKEKMLELIDRDIEYYDNMFLLAFLVTFILSGLIIMITMFFSVKERIYEIGIRKSAGANNFEIMKQFIVETILFTIISSVFAIIFIFAVTGVVNFINNNGFTLFISNKSIVIYLLIVLLQSLIFSLAPAVYATKIKIIDALNFE